MNLDSLKLRKTIASDLDIFFQHQADEQYNYMAAFTPQNYTDKAAYITKWTKIIALENVSVQTILLDEVIVGSISHFLMDDEINVTYGIGKEFWGKGITTKALDLFLKIVPLRPLYGRVAYDNHGSKRVLEKCGFQQIATEHGFANARGKEIEEFVLKLN